MTHRYTGELGRRLEGNLPRAHEVQGTARLLVQQCINEIGYRGGQGQAYRTQRLGDGTIVKAIVLQNIRGMQPIVRVEVFAPLQGGVTEIVEHLHIGGFIFDVGEDDNLNDDTALITAKYLFDSPPWMFVWLKPDSKYSNIEAYTGEDQLLAGYVTWQSKLPPSNKTDCDCVLSWEHGLPTRYRLGIRLEYDCYSRLVNPEIFWTPLGMEYTRWSYPRTSRAVFMRGFRFDVPRHVLGAGFFAGKVVYVSYGDATTELLHNAVSFFSFDPTIPEAQFSPGTRSYQTTPKYLGTYTLGSPSVSSLPSPWFFTPDGSRASTVATMPGAESSVQNRYVIHSDLKVTENLETGDEITLEFSTEQKNPTFPPSITKPETRTFEGSAGPGGQYKFYNIGPIQCFPVGVQYGALAGQPIVSLGGIHGLLSGAASRYVDAAKKACPDSADSFYVIDADFTQLNEWVDLVSTTSTMVPYSRGLAVPRFPDNGHSHAFVPTSVYGASYWKANCGHLDTDAFPPGNVGLYVAQSFRVDARTDRTERVIGFPYNRYNVIAVDYDSAGNELVVSCKLTGEGSYAKYNTRYDASVRMEAANFPKNQGYDIHYEIEDEWEARFSAKWELLVNDAPLIVARAGMISAEHERDLAVLYRNHYRESDSTPEDDEVERVTETYAETGDARFFFTERVWVIDVDARSMSACYLKSTAVYSIKRTTEKPDDLDTIDLDDALVSCRTYMEVVIEGTLARQQEVEAVAPTGELRRLYEGYFMYQMLPRMWSANDGREWDLNSAQYAGGPLEFHKIADRFWDVQPFERYPNRRIWGALASRFDQVAFSFDDRALIRTGPEGDQPRNLTIVTVPADIQKDVPFSLDPIRVF